jgi:hypothetical protein
MMAKNNKDSEKNQGFSNSFNLKSIEDAIISIFANFAGDFKNRIVKEYNLPEEDVMKVLKECIILRTSNAETVLGKIAIKRESTIVSDSGEIIDKPGCMWTLLRGPRKNTACNGRTVKDSQYCSSHNTKISSKKSISEINFNIISENSELYEITGTSIVVGKYNFNKPLTIENSEIMGYIDPIKSLNTGAPVVEPYLPEKAIKYAREHNIKLSEIVKSDLDKKKETEIKDIELLETEEIIENIENKENI